MFYYRQKLTQNLHNIAFTQIFIMNLNVLDISCDSSEQCSCIFTAVPSKAELLGKKKQKQHQEYYKDLYCLLMCSSKMRNMK